MEVAILIREMDASHLAATMKNHLKKVGGWTVLSNSYEGFTSFTAFKNVGHYRGVSADTIEFMDSPRSNGEIKVTERHALTPTEVFCVQITHIGKNPFTKRATF
jgi:hypothetical protein